MMRRYISKTKLTMPYTRDRYTVSLNGAIYDTQLDSTVEPVNGQVNLCVLDQDVWVEHGWAVAMAFKPLFQAETFALNWKVLHADGITTNLHPINLIWQPPLGGQPCPNQKGYYVIPGFSMFSVSENGQVYGRRLNRNVKTRRAAPKVCNGYINFTVHTDSDESTVMGVHRAMALAFLSYDRHVVQMTVNHKNGRKDDNRLVNIEFSTYRDNNIHAMDMNLRTSRVPVLVKDYYTGEVYEFNSYSSAAAFIGVNSGAVYNSANGAHKAPVKYRYDVRKKDEFVKWRDFTRDELEKMQRVSPGRKNSECYAINIYTGRRTLANNPNELAAILELPVDLVRSAIEAKTPWPSMNHVFGWLKSPKEFLAFKEDELIAFRGKSGIRKPVRVTVKDTGQTYVFTSIRGKHDGSIDKFLHLPKRTVETKLRTVSIYETEQFKVEYIAPE